MSRLSDVISSAWCFPAPPDTTPGPLEWAAVGLAAALVLWVFYKAIRHTLCPGEASPDHIKRRVLEDGELP